MHVLLVLASLPCMSASRGFLISGGHVFGAIFIPTLGAVVVAVWTCVYICEYGVELLRAVAVFCTSQLRYK